MRNINTFGEFHFKGTNKRKPCDIDSIIDGTSTLLVLVFSGLSNKTLRKEVNNMDLYFSDNERLILLNQYRILAEIARIQENQSDAEFYDTSAEIISGGYQHEYEEYFRLGQPLASKTCSDIWSILDIYDTLQLSARRIDNVDLMHRCRFPGFDGNHETDLLRYCRFVLNTLKRFSGLELESADINSHREMIEHYNAQLEKYQEMGNPPILSEEQINIILSV